MLKFFYICGYSPYHAMCTSSHSACTGLVYVAFARANLEACLRERAKAMELEEKRDREGRLLQALQADDLVASEVITLTVAVLKAVILEWRHSKPFISDSLHLSGPK